MTEREEFERWAHDNGLVNLHHRAVALKAWKAGVAAERERSGRICESLMCGDIGGGTDDMREGFRQGCGECAAAIRRGE